MHIPPELIIHQTRHWTLNQRIDSALPGYCMLGSRQPATAFHQLPEQALAEFGPLLARVEREMDALLRPRLWGGGHIGAGERVASDGWRPDAARASGVGASNV